MDVYSDDDEGSEDERPAGRRRALPIFSLVLHAITLVLVGVALYFALAPFVHGRTVAMSGDVIGYSNSNTLRQINSANVTCSSGQVFLTSGLVLNPVCSEGGGGSGNFSGSAGCYGGNSSTQLIVPRICVDSEGRTVSITNTTVQLTTYEGSITVYGILNGSTMTYSAARVGDLMVANFHGLWGSNTSNCTGADGVQYLVLNLPAALQSSSLPTLDMVSVISASVMQAGLVTPSAGTTLTVGCHLCPGAALDDDFPPVAACGVSAFTIVYPMTT